MRLPLVPTLFVAVAVPTMMGLGVWQLQRADWKAGMLVQLSAAQTAPLLDLQASPMPGGLNFRSVRILLSCPVQPPQARAGRSRDGAAGYAHLLDCTTSAGERIRLNAGWSARPLTALPALAGAMRGTLVAGDGKYTLVAATPAAGLIPSAPPSLTSISNNHRAYAAQWFFFAATLTLIYALYVRSISRGKNRPS